MSSGIIGLSHIVFTIEEGKSPGKGIEMILNNHFIKPEYLELDNSLWRLPLLRNESNALSKIALYKAADHDLPAIEFLHVSKTDDTRQKFCGVFLNNKMYPFLGNELFVDEDISELPTDGIEEVTIRKKFIQILNTLRNRQVNIQHGCWCEVKDFDSQKAFFKSIPGASFQIETEDFFVVRSKVVNKRFSWFSIMLIRSEKYETDFYNDDMGLSTLGWFVKALEVGVDEESEFLSSPVFPVSINMNTFNALFLYTNMGISHELLKIKQ